MSLIFTALTPHPPMLIPAIGKEQLEQLAQTKKALEQLERDLYVARPQIIIVISPHGSLFADSFSVNAHTHFTSAFEEFGDLSTKLSWFGAPELAANISHRCKEGKMPVQLVSQERLDHGTTVPLFFLANHLLETKILPIGYSELNTETHLKYGEILKDIILNSDKRIAVIVSGDLSHGLNVNAPAPYHDDCAVFDKNIMEMLEIPNIAGIVTMDPNIIKNASECGYRSLLIGLGILKNIDFKFKLYSYEAPFGVGYLAGNFVL